MSDTVVWPVPCLRSSLMCRLDHDHTFGRGGWKLVTNQPFFCKEVVMRCRDVLQPTAPAARLGTVV
jgi:hypothetical protein